MRVGIATDHGGFELKEDLKSWLTGLGHVVVDIGQRRGEDTPVVARLMRERRLALLDAPQLYAYVQHGRNTFDAGHFAQQWAAADRRFENAEYENIISGLSGVFAFNEYPVTAT